MPLLLTEEDILIKCHMRISHAHSLDTEKQSAGSQPSSVRPWESPKVRAQSFRMFLRRWHSHAVSTPHCQDLILVGGENSLQKGTHWKSWVWFLCCSWSLESLVYTDLGTLWGSRLGQHSCGATKSSDVGRWTTSGHFTWTPTTQTDSCFTELANTDTSKHWNPSNVSSSFGPLINGSKWAPTHLWTGMNVTATSPGWYTPTGVLGRDLKILGRDLKMTG